MKKGKIISFFFCFLWISENITENRKQNPFHVSQDTSSSFLFFSKHYRTQIIGFVEIIMSRIRFKKITIQKNLRGNKISDNFLFPIISFFKKPYTIYFFYQSKKTKELYFIILLEYDTSYTYVTPFFLQYFIKFI